MILDYITFVSMEETRIVILYQDPLKNDWDKANTLHLNSIRLSSSVRLSIGYVS
jgi:uracil DNA glycosylase